MQQRPNLFIFFFELRGQLRVEGGGEGSVLVAGDGDDDEDDEDDGGTVPPTKMSSICLYPLTVAGVIVGYVGRPMKLFFEE